MHINAPSQIGRHSSIPLQLRGRPSMTDCTEYPFLADSLTPHGRRGVAFFSFFLFLFVVSVTAVG